MKVYKFGGASIQDSEAIRNVGKILTGSEHGSLVLVISAMAGVTNSLEQMVAECFEQGGVPQAALEEFMARHRDVTTELLGDTAPATVEQLQMNFSELTVALEGSAHLSFDTLYDQIVCFGELCSSRIVSDYLNKIGYQNKLVDARKLVRTDNTFRDANVYWEKTGTTINESIPPLLSQGAVITQGFIAGTDEDLTTTLGREGSDFSAAIFAYALDAEEVHIWKDVPGVLNADPRYFEDTNKIDQLSYQETIEMSYYGAKVIHPNTIRPLQNKKIPLWVRSFKDPDAEGTLIGHRLMTEKIPPMVVLKKAQVLLSISPRDFAFITEDRLSIIYRTFAKHRVKINMMQNSAISFTACIDDSDRIKVLIADLEENYKVLQNQRLELITIRHYNDEMISNMSEGREILVEQKSRHTLQLVVQAVS